MDYHYHIAICDDESSARARLAEMALAWAAARGVAMHIDDFPSAEAFAFHYAEEKDFDILLLDIELGGMNGVELAKTVRAENREVQIVFVTGYMDYIADGYDVEALHYLLKPTTADKLYAVLDRAAEKLQRNSRTLMLRMPQESVRVPLGEIHYLEVRRNYVTVHARESYTVKGTLNEMALALDDTFLRVGRSFLVNLRSIRQITKTEALLINGARIPIPRDAYELVNRAMIDRL